MSRGNKVTYTYQTQTELSGAAIIEHFEKLHRLANNDIGWHSVTNYPDYSLMSFFEDTVVIKNFNSSKSGKGTIYNVFISFENQGLRNTVNVNFKTIANTDPIYWCLLVEIVGVIGALTMNIVFQFSIVSAVIFLTCTTVLALLMYWSNAPTEPDYLKDCVKLILSDVDIHEEILAVKNQSK